MDILVSKPTQADIKRMQAQPTWGCEVSEFDWHYDADETALILEGEVTVEYAGKSVNFSAGDLVSFPKGLSCYWRVKRPVLKHYIFE